MLASLLAFPSRKRPKTHLVTSVLSKPKSKPNAKTGKKSGASAVTPALSPAAVNQSELLKYLNLFAGWFRFQFAGWSRFQFAGRFQNFLVGDLDLLAPFPGLVSGPGFQVLGPRDPASFTGLEPGFDRAWQIQSHMARAAPPFPAALVTPPGEETSNSWLCPPPCGQVPYEAEFGGSGY